MSRLYLDACCIIYLEEATGTFHAAVVARILRHRADPRSIVVTSRLSRLECRTLPLKNADTGLLLAYERFFSGKRVFVAEVTPAVIESATELRARFGFKTPDAIHLATAIEAQVDRFLTGDATLTRCTEVAVEVLVP
ncbi:MAG: PIN domain-containing protein [Candidatus Riflebacteria bacterium]|nr:PIN domain-containing protein [Candidatus Riflebacteria bacterium]